jgi:hypothetical protein
MGPVSPLPIYPDSNSNHGQEKGAYAVLSSKMNRFEVYRKGHKFVGEYELPVYPTQAGTVKRVLLTPFTLTADVTIVGGIAALYVLAHYHSSGCP